MTAVYAAIATLIISIVVIAVALFVSSKRLPSDASATSTVYRARLVYFILISVAVVAALGFTIPMTPYPVKFAEQRPDLLVKVTGEMWNWTLTPSSGADTANGNLVLPVGKLVEFDVSSKKDVNHNFCNLQFGGRIGRPGAGHARLYQPLVLQA